jgi:hypothetical protein
VRGIIAREANLYEQRLALAALVQARGRGAQFIDHNPLQHSFGL